MCHAVKEEDLAPGIKEEIASGIEVPFTKEEIASGIVELTGSVPLPSSLGGEGTVAGAVVVTGTAVPVPAGAAPEGFGDFGVGATVPPSTGATVPPSTGAIPLGAGVSSSSSSSSSSRQL